MYVLWPQKLNDSTRQQLTRKMDMDNQPEAIELQPGNSDMEELIGSPETDLADMPEMTLTDVADVLSLTIRNDYDNKIITFLCMLSAYTDSSQINVSFNAPSSSGKTYITVEIAKLFPAEDKIERSGASPTSFFYSEGTMDKKRGVKVVSLERKILLFYEQPNPELQKRLRAVLSHDQRELRFSNTNKDKKGSNRAEQTIIRGYPATVFCSAGLQLDEQEATRALLLSPEVSEAKLKEGVHLQALRGADEAKFEEWLESRSERIALKNRIIAIRNERIDDIIVTDPEGVEQRFNGMFTKPKPRHMRDMGHLMRLIKAVALLNVWYRRQPDGTIVASQSDTEKAFELWSKVFESQDMNVPPILLSFYNNILVPAYLEKMNDPEFATDMKLGFIGLSSQELSAYYLRVEQTVLNEDQLRKQILPMLISSSMIAVEPPTYGDRRSKHIFPKWNLVQINSHFDGNNIGKGGGVTGIDDEALKLFFA